jgi:hypothetical protein
MYNFVSLPYNTGYIKITKYILSELGINIDTWLTTRVFVHYRYGNKNTEFKDILNVDTIMQSSTYKYFKKMFNNIPMYDSTTDADISGIIELLQPSLELSKKKVNPNSSGVQPFMATIGSNGYLKVDGGRLHKKQKTRKRRHQRKASTHSKKQ